MSGRGPRADVSRVSTHHTGTSAVREAHRVSAAAGRHRAARPPHGGVRGVRRLDLPPVEGPVRRALLRSTALAAVLATWAYLLWRMADTLPSGPALWIGVPFLLLELYGGIALVLYVVSTWNVTPAVVPVSTGPAPTVTVLIATYDEHLDILLPTVAACLGMDGDHETWVLDDGDRFEVAEMVTALGARYVSRPVHDHAKAGNLNHALRMVTTDLVAVFDADHVPERHFLTRTLPYFADQRLALVQTPQDFYNTSSFEHLHEGSALHEESLFYRVIQAGKHNAGAAFWCGTNAVLRVRALRDVGGVATESLTEDFHTTMKLHRAGWRSAYHNEVLARGLAAGGPDAFFAQRRRWGRGAMQVLRHDNPLTSSGLTWAQRISYVYSLSAWFDSWRTLGLALVPVAVVTTGLFPVTADPLLFGVLAGGSFLLQQAAVVLLSRGFTTVRFALLFDVIRMPSNLAATLSLVRRGTGRFAVTAKGRTGEERRRAAAPPLLLALAAVLTAAIGYAGATFAGLTPARYPFSWSIAVAVTWLGITLILVVAAIRRIRDLRFGTERRDAHRFPSALPTTMDGTPAQLFDVSLGGAQLRVWGTGAEVGEDVLLAITVPDRDEPVPFLATVRSRRGPQHRVQFVGRQWESLAELSSVAFGAGAARRARLWANTAAPSPDVASAVELDAATTAPGSALLEI
jgi:cellulose synthase/poly-beta-1,6-N-acetylglucosamine synthase-like glycosyltransferase